MGQSWTNKARKLGMLCAVNLSLYLNCFAGVDQGEKKVTLNVVEESCVKVFKQIEKQTKMSFFYSTSDIRLPGKVSIKVVDAALDEVMGRILEGTNLEWIYTDNVITIRKKKGLVGGGNGTGIAADSNINMITVTGKVTQADGTGIPGATVRIKRTGDGATSDENGSFSLPNTKITDILVISSIGYQSREVPVKGKSFLVQLAIDINKLDETVIKGYYNTTKRLNTGNVSSVKAETISSQPVGDPIASLIGRVAGLSIVQTSGLPGSSYTVRLRGQNSIASGNDPLYIVDGVPFTSSTLTNRNFGGGALGFTGMSPFNSLNPRDIESIEVLKDADATAIYGSRGANGVIIITTKKGSVGKTSININYYHGLGRVPHFIDLLNTDEYLRMRHEAFTNDQEQPGDGAYDLNGAWDTTRSTDWQKVMIGGTSKINDAQISLSGGSENTQFLIGSGYRDETTVFPGNFIDRRGVFRSSITHSSANKKLILTLSSSYSAGKSLLPNADFTNQIALAPNAPELFDSLGRLNWPNYNGRSTWTNPLALLLQTAKATTSTLISNLNIKYELLKGLRITTALGYRNMQMNQSLTVPLTSFDPSLSALTFLRSNSTGNATDKSWIIEPQLNYVAKFGKGTIDVLIGTTFQENTSSSMTINASDFASDDLIQNPAAAVNQSISNNDSKKYRYEAIFSRLNFNWNNKYLINVTGRRDGSSRFGASNHYGNFGAVGIGWIFSEERFIKNNILPLSFGKIRLSYGITGNDQIGDYQYISRYASLGLTYQNLNGLYPTSLTNPNYSWERVKKLETGIELGFLSDKILLNFNFFNNQTDNQLVGYPLPRITGFSTVQANLPAKIRNRGFEFELTTTNVSSKTLKWLSSINFSLIRNKLLAYPNIEASSYANSYTIGQPLSDLKAFHYIGINPQTGIYIFDTKDQNQQPTYPNDLISFKRSSQNFSGGVQNSIEIKGFKLDVFFQFVKQKGINYLSLFTLPGYFSSESANQPREILNRWQKPGDVTKIQQFTQKFDAAYNAWANAFTYSDLNSSDASFIRLKSLSLSYDISENWLNRLYVDHIKLYSLCQNVFTITNYKGLDPETQGLVLPPLRLITFGVNVTF